MGKLNLCFQVDTDNPENFPSEAAFQTFKNQRHTFHEIFRIWGKNHSVRGWTFQIALANKIRTMLTLPNDAANYYHFARLFKSHLISYTQNGQQTERWRKYKRSYTLKQTSDAESGGWYLKVKDDQYSLTQWKSL